jgi:hypothetical protein
MKRPKPEEIHYRIKEMMETNGLRLDSEELDLLSIIRPHGINHQTPILHLPIEVCYDLLVPLFLYQFEKECQHSYISASNIERFLYSMEQDALRLIPMNHAMIKEQFERVRQAIVIKQVVPSKKREITLVFFCHGCDDPTVRLEGKIPVEKVKVMSVKHGCIAYGRLPSIYKTVNQSFKSRTRSQAISLSEVKETVKKTMGYDLTSLYTPISNRRLWFNRVEQSEFTAIPIAGIYIVGSTIETDDIQYQWNGDPVLLSDENNLLSDKLHPSLKLYQQALQRIRSPIWDDTQPIAHINSIDIMGVLLEDLQLDQLKLLDWGCRKTCIELKHALGRIPSIEYMERNAGKKHLKRRKSKRNAGKKYLKRRKSKRFFV